MFIDPKGGMNVRNVRAALVLFVGAPGSGRSTLARRWFTGSEVVNLDTIRWQLTGDEADQSATPAAFEIQNRIIQHRLSRGLMTAVDATNTNRAHVNDLYMTACGQGLPTIGVVLHTPLDVCIARQVGRRRPTNRAPNGRAVPTTVIEEAHAQVAAGWDIRRRVGVWCALHVGPDGAEVVRHGTVPPQLRDPIVPWLDGVPEVAFSWVPWLPPKPCPLCGVDIELSRSGRIEPHGDCGASRSSIDYVKNFMIETQAIAT